MIKRSFRILKIIILGSFANQTLAEVHNSTIIVYTEEHPPYTYVDEEGQILGDTADKIKSFLAQSRLDYQIEILPWKRAVMNEKQTPLSLIYPLTRNKKRENLYHWLHPIESLTINLYALSSKFDAHDRVVGKGYKFSCYNQSAYCELLSSMGVPDSSIVVLGTGDTNVQFKLVLRNRVDFIITSEEVFYEAIKFLGRQPSEFVRLVNYQFEITDYLAASKNTPAELLEKIQALSSDTKN